eukprot:1086717-Prorocentrum_minimum.AAC.3
MVNVTLRLKGVRAVLARERGSRGLTLIMVEHSPRGLAPDPLCGEGAVVGWGPEAHHRIVVVNVCSQGGAGLEGVGGDHCRARAEPAGSQIRPP